MVYITKGPIAKSEDINVIEMQIRGVPVRHSRPSFILRK
jgi:hypothetical protein